MRWLLSVSAPAAAPSTYTLVRSASEGIHLGGKPMLISSKPLFAASSFLSHLGIAFNTAHMSDIFFCVLRRLT
jgi:hypothetical protein